MKKVALDIHGTIDSDPEFFSWLTKRMKGFGFEIHITTGVKVTKELVVKLLRFGIEFDHIFSIIDYHEKIGTKVTYDERGPWISEEDWDRTKGDYCERNEIDLTIDDSPNYGKHFETGRYLLWQNGEKEGLRSIVGEEGNGKE